MSRCFPYPPPGYCRNGATYEALIESIKLQKETDKLIAERKKEKKAKKEKKVRRQKEKRNSEDVIKLQKSTDGGFHKLQKTAECTEAQIKATNVTNELLEKSDLTEEHGPSNSSHQPSYSSDSTQNSNKRKRDCFSSLQDGSTDHAGKPIKIRLLKKHAGSDFSNFGADARSATRPSVPSSSHLDTSVVLSISSSGRERRGQAKSSQISEGSKIRDPNRLHFGRIQSAPSSAKPILQSSRPQQAPIHLEHEIPSSSHIDEEELHSGTQQQLAQSHYGMSNPLSNKASTSAAGERPNNKIPGSKGASLTSFEKRKEDPEKVGLTRHEKKMLKKHAKYEKLIGSWLPPVLQAHLPDVDDDDDWFSIRKTSNSSISVAEVETCRQSVSSLQPCAWFLAEADIHALPYTVPF